MINKISNGSVSGRLYGLDLSRCILLLLGYFFHAYMFYRGVMSFYHQPQFIESMLQSDFLNQLMWRIIVWVHLFRMPAFFTLRVKRRIIRSGVSFTFLPRLLFLRGFTIKFDALLILLFLTNFYLRRRIIG